jgi:hypothetical protein
VNQVRALQVIGAIVEATGKVPAQIASQKTAPMYPSLQNREQRAEAQSVLDLGAPQHREAVVRTVEWRSVSWADVTHDGQGLYRLHHQKRMWLFWDFGEHGIVVEAPSTLPRDVQATMMTRARDQKAD